MLTKFRVGELCVRLVENPHLAARLGLELFQGYPADIAVVAAWALVDGLGQEDDLLTIEPLQDIVERQEDCAVGISAQSIIEHAEELRAVFSEHGHKLVDYSCHFDF